MRILFIISISIAILFGIFAIRNIIIIRKKQKSYIPNNTIDDTESSQILINKTKYRFLSDLATSGYFSEDIQFKKCEIVPFILERFSIFLELSGIVLGTLQKFQNYVIEFYKSLANYETLDEIKKEELVNSVKIMEAAASQLAAAERQIFNQIHNNTHTSSEDSNISNKEIAVELVQHYIKIANTFNLFVESYLAQYSEVHINLERSDPELNTLFIEANQKFLAFLFITTNSFIHVINNSITIYL